MFSFVFAKYCQDLLAAVASTTTATVATSTQRAAATSTTAATEATEAATAATPTAAAEAAAATSIAAIAETTATAAAATLIWKLEKSCSMQQKFALISHLIFFASENLTNCKKFAISIALRKILMKQTNACFWYCCNHKGIDHFAHIGSQYSRDLNYVTQPISLITVNNIKGLFVLLSGCAKASFTALSYFVNFDAKALCNNKCFH